MNTGPVARAISRRTRLDQSGRCGSFQSRCVTRTLPVTRRSSQVCQCVGPLDLRPGTMSVFGMEVVLGAVRSIEANFGWMNGVRSTPFESNVTLKARRIGYTSFGPAL